MPNVQELLRRVEALIDDTLDTASVVAWFNGAHGALSDSMYLPCKKTILRDGVTGGFALPTDINGTLAITEPTDHTYEVWDGFMYLAGGQAETATTITVTYNRFPSDVTASPSYIPELDPRFHDAYVFWAAMQAMNPEEEPGRYSQYERDFNRLKAQMTKHYGGMRVKPSAWGVIR